MVVFLISFKSALLATCDAKDGKCVSSLRKLHLIALFSTGLFSNHIVNDVCTLSADARVRGSDFLDV